MNSCSFLSIYSEKRSYDFDEQRKECKAFINDLKTRIHFEMDYGLRHFLCVLNNAIDLFFAELILGFKNELCCGITLKCIIPDDKQCPFVDERQKVRYFTILERCDDVIYLKIDKEKDCTESCNLYMLENTDMMFVAWDESLDTTLYQVIKASIRLDKRLCFVRL